MKLSSPAFDEGELIDPKYTCDGENVSPALKWQDVPGQAKSLALIMDDPDAPSGVFVHWLLFDIPATEKGLAEGAGNKKGGVGLHGKNGFGKVAYGGPCPPSGTHRYYFRLYALDKSPAAQPGVSRSQLDAAMGGHILAEAQLMGRYTRQR